MVLAFYKDAVVFNKKPIAEAENVKAEGDNTFTLIKVNQESYDFVNNEFAEKE